MSVRGVTSPSILKAVRASRTATLKDVHPRYASFPMRLARLSPTRCQNSTTPSAPAFSIMSSIREARATSIMSDLRRSSSHEGAELRLEVLRYILVFLELLRLAELLDEQDAREPLEFPGDGFVVRGQDFRRDRPGLEQVADDDRRLDHVREDPLHLRDLDGLRRQEH